MRRKRWLERTRISRQEEKELEQKKDDKEEKRGPVEVVPNKAAEAVRKGLAITNIKFGS